MDSWKSRGGKSQRGEVKKWEDQRGQKVKKKEDDAGARKGRKVAIHCVFPMICGSRGSKTNFAKAAGAELSGQMNDEKLHAVVANQISRVKMCKAHQIRTTFGSWDVKKVHAVVARSTFPSQKCKKLMGWPLLEVEMSKKCTPLWCEAHFHVKSAKFEPFLTFRCRKSAHWLT